MSEPECPCGEDHSDRQTYQALLAIIADKGEFIPIEILGSPSRTLVPRMFIAYHGLKAWEVAGLAEKYGWSHE